ncbi:uncharacterized protein LOC112568540 isoform X2 [Pomacea canaliculata]|uniref:uncharacterized protein LOC112568540 isoform X2 n=1 Tax=Pomacea canaliculata TaxID=400727 RepID=UPI000D7287E9|nr:uncharacterized protein LOC112568540 isoform X2 [Pomacea canaliculata]
MTVIELLQLLLLTFVMRILSGYKSLAQAAERKTTCGISRLPDTLDMMLTCYFYDNISAVQKDFTVFLYQGKESPKPVVLCGWSPEITCYVAPGYEYTYDIDVHPDHTKVRLLNSGAEHVGMYTCQVMGESDTGTCRLTEKQNHLFLVNGVHNRTVSASEDSPVEMVCQSDTWTPTRIISVVDGDRLLASRSSNEMLSGRLRYMINKTRCEDTGDYRCEFADTTRLFYSETVRLLVPCAPRKKTEEGLSPFVVNNDSNGHVSFEMIAYPIPNVKTYYKLKLNSIEPIKDRMQTTCASESMKFASIICNITVINVTNADDGAQFMVVFSNNLGELPFTFRIGLNGKLLDK